MASRPNMFLSLSLSLSLSCARSLAVTGAPDDARAEGALQKGVAERERLVWPPVGPGVETPARGGRTMTGAGVQVGGRLAEQLPRVEDEREERREGGRRLYGLSLAVFSSLLLPLVSLSSAPSAPPSLSPLLVFFCMDFPSVYQEPRATPGQKEIFKRRLQSVNVWYRRQSAQVWRHRRGAAVPWPGLARVRVEGRLAEQLPRVRPREIQ